MIDDVRDMASRRRDAIDRADGVGWHPRVVADPDPDDAQKAEAVDVKRLAMSAAKLSVRVKELGCWFPIDGAP